MIFCCIRENERVKVKEQSGNKDIGKEAIPRCMLGKVGYHWEKAQ